MPPDSRQSPSHKTAQSDVLEKWAATIPTTYTVNLSEPPHEWITVELTCLAGQGPHKPPRDTWAVRKGGMCLDSDDEWMWEPIPSSRGDAFYERTRWTLDSAVARAYRVAQREANWRRDAR
jgi:hypothetical protein